MNKNEFIERRGKVAYERYRELHRNWQKANPNKVNESNRAHGRKGGKSYLKTLKHKTTGIPGERNKIRVNHGRNWFEYKHIIAPNSQIHHEWIPGTSNYTGVALVEKEQHQHGVIDVIQILDGDITLLSEKEIRGR